MPSQPTQQQRPLSLALKPRPVKLTSAGYVCVNVGYVRMEGGGIPPWLTPKASQVILGSWATEATQTGDRVLARGLSSPIPPPQVLHLGGWPWKVGSVEEHAPNASRAKFAFGGCSLSGQGLPRDLAA